ncbi:MAG TPA: ATP-dependent sacrificial sulfur transferase LarE [Acidimicrobiales bacterium]|nr:ATP-dependent sacrificial sulfur transferase LarE [Acidimicrobiales bacterium]
MTTPASGDLAQLLKVLSSFDRLVVAFSGGVDSGLLAWAANQALGPDRCIAATAVSPSLSPSELDDCRRLGSLWGLRWQAVQTDEASRPGYTANGPDRCYHCKSELMDRLAPIAEAERAHIALGVNVDDLDDHRPGQKAAREQGAAFPLVEAGLTKAAVRRAARDAGLDIWDKPAAACLASRVPYGTEVTLSTLSRVARAEEALKGLGYRDLRVRHYGDLARLELTGGDLETAVADRRRIVDAVRAAGYRYVTLDLEGLRSGNLNAAFLEGR